MPQDLKDGETHEMQGSGKKPYILKNVGGAYSCSCPAWRNQSEPIDKRTCKHLRKLRGDAAEEDRIKKTLDAIVTPKSDVVAPDILLAHTWDSSIDPTGYWMSEKLDGVRALWRDRKFITRQGHEYLAPLWFSMGLPDNQLDGELWIGRKQFQKTVSIVRRVNAGDLWREVKYVVFDLPGAIAPFEERLLGVPVMVASCKYAVAHPHTLCKGVAHLNKTLAQVEAQGGEGLMLRKPGSLYETGRSMTLLKVKSFKDDEATVIGHAKGKGRHKGRLGALECKLANGIEFEVGTGLSDAERDNPPAVGTVIKFKYQELSDGGVPRFPSYIGIHEEQ